MEIQILWSLGVILAGGLLMLISTLIPRRYAESQLGDWIAYVGVLMCVFGIIFLNACGDHKETQHYYEQQSTALSPQ